MLGIAVTFLRRSWWKGSFPENTDIWIESKTEKSKKNIHTTWIQPKQECRAGDAPKYSQKSSQGPGPFFNS